jgi:hypothetical protein
VGDFEKGADILARVRAQLADGAPQLEPIGHARAAATGAAFRPGDEVRDKATGEVGHVEHVQWAHFVTPAPRGPGG